MRPWVENAVVWFWAVGPFEELVLSWPDRLPHRDIGCKYVANILLQRERVPATPGALHLTRRQDLLDLDIPAADLDLYERKQQNQTKPT